MPSKRQKKAGFELPDPVLGYPLLDVCLKIPNAPEYRRAFLGHLYKLGLWAIWEKSYLPGDTRARDAAELWRETLNQYLDMGCDDMNCCCDDPPAQFRYNSDGIYQRSTEGGATWVDAPEYDYRNISTIFPPPSALGISNTKCQAADGAVVILNQDVLQGLDNGASVQALLEFVAAVLILFLSAGTLATVSIALFSMAAAIVGFGISSTKAAFTSTVLNQLRCTLYCNMATDDSIDADGISRVLTDINDNYIGIVKTSLYSLISAAGAVGITNMMRSNRGSASADCSACCPAATVYVWDELASAPTQIFPDDLGVYTAHSGVTQSGGFYICSIYFYNGLPVPAHYPCHNINVITDGSGGAPFKYRCADYIHDPLATCVAQYTFRNASVPFDMTFTLEDECGSV